MLKLGEIQKLSIVKKTDFGVYLGEAEHPEERVLLPQKEVPEQAAPGDTLEVFLYRDSRDRLIATTRRPALTLGQTAVLTVRQVTKIGAFLDWGLEKDLFLPFRQQTRKVEEGDECLVALYIDKSGRLCAAMNVYRYLSSDSPYRKDSRVEGTVYETSREFGAFVAVDNKYSALIPRREGAEGYHVGDKVEARVTRVLPDGRLDLSVREKAYLQMEKDAEKIMRALDECGGVLPYTDKTSPEILREKFGLSKNAFKRAVGHLFKEELVELDEDAIRKC